MYTSTPPTTTARTTAPIVTVRPRPSLHRSHQARGRTSAVVNRPAVRAKARGTTSANMTSIGRRSDRMAPIPGPRLANLATPWARMTTADRGHVRTGRPPRLRPHGGPVHDGRGPPAHLVAPMERGTGPCRVDRCGGPGGRGRWRGRVHGRFRDAGGRRGGPGPDGPRLPARVRRELGNARSCPPPRRRGRHHPGVPAGDLH